MVTAFQHYNDVTDRRAASVWPPCGCPLELSHTSKNNGNPDLVCEKFIFLSLFPNQNIDGGYSKDRLNAGKL